MSSGRKSQPINFALRSPFLMPLSPAAIFQQSCHQRGPSRLMACPQTQAGVAVKIFIKQNQIPPVRVFGETPIRSVAWPAAIIILVENPH
jgi:hypothetical protein